MKSAFVKRPFRGSLSSAALFAVAIATGCRDSEPPQVLFRDLGESGRPLLPTPSAWVDQSVRSGRADWVPFPDPQEAAPSGAGEPAAPGAEPAQGGADHAALEKQIRDTVAEYNRMLAEGRDEDLPTFFIEGQGAVVGQLTEVLPQVVAKLKELNQALPEQNERFAQALERASLENSLGLELSTVEVAGAGEATGSLASGGRIRFALADDGYWYIDLPALESVASSLPMMSQATQSLDRLISAVKAGEAAADSVTQQLDSLIPMITPLASGGTGAEAPAGGPAAPDAPPAEPTSPATGGGQP